MFGVELKRFFEDIVTSLKREKTKSALCVALSILGAVLGIVFFKISNYNWWYCNRCAFAEKILYGGIFSLFLNYLFCATVVCVATSLSVILPQTRILCYVLLPIVGLYFGANCCALIACGGALLGVFYIVLLILEQGVNMLCCFLTLCNCPCRRTFGEAFVDNKICLILQICSIFCKLLLIFALIRLITALI